MKGRVPGPVITALWVLALLAVNYYFWIAPMVHGSPPIEVQHDLADPG
ncbi:MAG: hypothetical protein SFX74_05770 [Fimbriimonadaceae bacterium]|nr:hypothetical protein [Fimbriimonadaceae bacterium]